MPRLLAAALLLFATGSTAAAEVRVSAAASLSDVLRELGAIHERATGDRVVFNFGASSMLARQIVEGAPADLFISADELRMNELTRRKLVRGETRRNLVSNTLVIVVRRDATVRMRAPRDLLNVQRIVIADPAGVPAGLYAKAYLTRLGMWNAVAPKMIPTANVRAALAAVESGNVDCGIVYATDARVSRHVRVAFVLAHRDGPAIVYPAAVLRDAEQPFAARRFLDFLASARATAVFRAHGFLPPR